MQVEEGDFLEIVTQTQRVVCHFYHRDFERCKLLDKHLTILARKYFDTRFIKLSAPVRMMPLLPTFALDVLSLVRLAHFTLGKPSGSQVHLKACAVPNGAFRVVVEHLSCPFSP